MKKVIILFVMLAMLLVLTSCKPKEIGITKEEFINAYQELITNECEIRETKLKNSKIEKDIEITTFHFTKNIKNRIYYDYLMFMSCDKKTKEVKSVTLIAPLDEVPHFVEGQKNIELRVNIFTKVFVRCLVKVFDEDSYNREDFDAFFGLDDVNFEKTSYSGIINGVSYMTMYSDVMNSVDFSAHLDNETVVKLNPTYNK